MDAACAQVHGISGRHHAHHSNSTPQKWNQYSCILDICPAETASFWPIYPDATVARKCHGERLFFCSHHYIFLIGACLSTITILICHSNAACHARTVHRSSSQTYLQFFMSIYSSISYLLFLQSPDAPKKYMLVLL
jgi:hypothetical protein